MSRAEIDDLLHEARHLPTGFERFETDGIAIGWLAEGAKPS